MDETTWKIIPFEGIGPLRFGMDADQVRDLLGNPNTFKRNEFSGGVTDAFREIGVFAEYDASDTLILVEAASPCTPIFQGIRLAGSVEEVVQALADAGHEGKQDDVGYSYDLYGFGLYAPSFEEIEGVSVFSEDYYD